MVIVPEKPPYVRQPGDASTKPDPQRALFEIEGSDENVDLPQPPEPGPDDSKLVRSNDGVHWYFQSAMNPAHLIIFTKSTGRWTILSKNKAANLGIYAEVLDESPV
jgi:hypothetical protein